MIKKLFFSILLLPSFGSFAQQNAITLSKDSTITFGGYAEAYYTYSKNATDQKPSFLYNHKRNNQVGLNLALLNAAYNEEKTRARVGVMFGDYAQYNYEGEPSWASFLYEANFGVLLNKKRNIWIDAGIFPSHIGFETPIANDCWSATRSIVSENSPYYESGIRLSGSSINKKSNWAFYYLNGWQKIIKPADISQPSFGAQYAYTPNDRFTFNYSNFVGRCQPDSLKSLRIYNDIFLKIAATKKIGVIIGFDFGNDSYQLNKTSWWFTPIVIGRFKIKEHNYISVRNEYFFDKNQIIIKNLDNKETSIYGCSLNYDRQLTEKSIFRIEFKHYSSTNKIFGNKSNLFSETQNYFTAGFSIKL